LWMCVKLIAGQTTTFFETHCIYIYNKLWKFIVHI